MNEKSGSPKQLVINAFRRIIESKDFRPEIIAESFSEAYIQSVDGKTLSYSGLLMHMKKQKEAIASVKVNFLAVAEEGDIVFTNHEVSVVKKDGDQATFKVIAQFTVRDGKIIACDELTRMLKGSNEDRDFGSRQ